MKDIFPYFTRSSKWLDDEGYPTEECLERITKWDYKDPDGLLRFIWSVWHWEDYVKNKGKTWDLHTGGWSGNEDIIAALRANQMFWSMWWYSSRRGGHYCFVLER